MSYICSRERSLLNCNIVKIKIYIFALKRKDEIRDEGTVTNHEWLKRPFIDQCKSLCLYINHTTEGKMHMKLHLQTVIEFTPHTHTLMCVADS